MTPPLNAPLDKLHSMSLDAVREVNAIHAVMAAAASVWEIRECPESKPRLRGPRAHAVWLDEPMAVPLRSGGIVPRPVRAVLPWGEPLF